MNLLQKVQFEIGCPDWHMTQLCSLRLRRFLWIYCLWHAGASGNERADRLASTVDITSGLHLDRAEVFEGLRNILNMDRPGIDRQPEGKKNLSRDVPPPRSGTISIQPGKHWHCVCVCVCVCVWTGLRRRGGVRVCISVAFFKNTRHMVVWWWSRLLLVLVLVLLLLVVVVVVVCVCVCVCARVCVCACTAYARAWGSRSACQCAHVTVMCACASFLAGGVHGDVYTGMCVYFFALRVAALHVFCVDNAVWVVNAALHSFNLSTHTHAQYSNASHSVRGNGKWSEKDQTLDSIRTMTVCQIHQGTGQFFSESFSVKWRRWLVGAVFALMSEDGTKTR